MKKLLLLMICVLLLTACQKENSKVTHSKETTRERETTTELSTRTPNSIVGTWYELVANDTANRWYFGEDGKYEFVYERSENGLYNHNGSYTIEDNVVTMINEEGEASGKYRIKYTDYGLKLMHADVAGKPHELYESRQQALETNPNYKKTETYYKSIADEDGYVIEDGVLIRYVGDAEEITIPSNVKDFDGGAIAGENVIKVTYPNTLKVITSGSITSESGIRYIYIEDGVKEIESYAFWDVYLWEIHIPDSVTKIGEKVIGVEEGSVKNSIKIFVKEGSYAHEYFMEAGFEDNLVIEE